MNKKVRAKQYFNLSVENMFLIIGLAFGTLFVFINAPFQANDEDRHFYRAYANASLKLLPIQQDSAAGNQIGTVYPKSVIFVAQSFQGIPFSNGRKISMQNLFTPMKEVSLNSDDTTFYMYPYSHMSFIPYIPHSVGIAAGKLIDSNPLWLLWFGRLAGMLAFVLIVYYAIRITPILKPVFFLAALTPMSLYQAASITYDSLSTATTFLLLALFLKYALDPVQKIGWREMAVILTVAFVQRFSKDGYILVPFMFLMIPSAKMEKKWFLWLGLGIFVLLFFLPDWTWGKIVARLNFRPNGEKPFQNDFRFDRSMNIDYYMNNPGEFISNIFANLMFWKSDWTGGVFGKFGYSYTVMPKALYIIHGLVLIMVAFFCGDRNYTIKTRDKVLAGAIVLASFALIVVGFYVGGSPVGAVRIFGMQGRYFVPFLPLILMLFYNKSLSGERWNRWGNYSIALYSIAILTYAVFLMKDTFYAP